jgi:rhamnulokinase
MPSRVRAFCAETNQAEPVEPGEVVRCILESLALKHAQSIELLASVTGAAARAVHVVGGGARNELLCRSTAEACGLPVYAGPEEATLVGNLLVQAMSLGELDSLADARALVAASIAPTVYEPRDFEAWQEARGRFAAAVALPGVEVGVR